VFHGTFEVFLHFRYFAPNLFLVIVSASQCYGIMKFPETLKIPTFLVKIKAFIDYVGGFENWVLVFRDSENEQCLDFLKKKVKNHNTKDKMVYSSCPRNISKSV
jgi:hypothetical protein